jgi:hypothetical protein
MSEYVTLGAVDFWSIEPHCYQTDYVLIARRIANHVALRFHISGWPRKRRGPPRRVR